MYVLYYWLGDIFLRIDNKQNGYKWFSIIITLLYCIVLYYMWFILFLKCLRFLLNYLIRDCISFVCPQLDHQPAVLHYLNFVIFNCWMCRVYNLWKLYFCWSSNMAFDADVCVILEVFLYTYMFDELYHGQCNRNFK